MPHVPPLFASARGFPPSFEGVDPDLTSRPAHWHLHRDFETPIAAIDRHALMHNSRVMHDWITAEGSELWPHAKTVMSPELVALQLKHGSAGMTAATMAQVRSLRSWGVTRVMLANQLVQRSAAAWIAQDRRRHPETVFWSFIDSPEGIGVLQDAAEAADVTLDVLIEVGQPGKRTGIRTEDQRDAIISALRTSPRVRAVGVAAYEGACAADREPSSLRAVDAYLDEVAAHLTELVAAGVVSAEDAVYSAGGSMFFDRVTQAARRLPFEARVVIRAGCYLLHDHGLYQRATPLPGRGDPDDPRGGLIPALTVWGTVHSRPEPTRAYLDVGRRDASYDQGLPVPLRRVRRGSTSAEPFDARVIALNDHHAHLEIAAGSDVEVGDRVELGISHPCTTMDKWRRVPIVDADGFVISTVATEF
jgi:D-serine deaminase-like pyridoxal phosphate-dependent protein